MSMQSKDKANIPAPSEEAVQSALSQVEIDFRGIRATEAALEQVDIEEISEKLGGIVANLEKDRDKLTPTEDQIKEQLKQLIDQNVDALNKQKDDADVIQRAIEATKVQNSDEIARIDKAIEDVKSIDGCLKALKELSESVRSGQVDPEGVGYAEVNNNASTVRDLLSRPNEVLADPIYANLGKEALEAAFQYTSDVARQSLVKGKFQGVEGKLESTYESAERSANRTPYPKSIKDEVEQGSAIERLLRKSSLAAVDVDKVVAQLKELEKELPEGNEKHAIALALRQIENMQSFRDDTADLSKPVNEQGIFDELNTKNVPTGLKAIVDAEAAFKEGKEELKSEATRAIYKLGLEVAENCEQRRLQSGESPVDFVQGIVKAVNESPVEIQMPNKASKIVVSELFRDQIEPVLVEAYYSAAAGEAPAKPAELAESIVQAVEKAPILEDIRKSLDEKQQGHLDETIKHQADQIARAFKKHALDSIGDYDARKLVGQSLEGIADQLAQMAGPFSKADQAYEDLRDLLGKQGIVIPERRDAVDKAVSLVGDALGKLKESGADKAEAYQGVNRLIEDKISEMRSALDPRDKRGLIENDTALQSIGLELQNGVLEASIVKLAKTVEQLETDTAEKIEKAKAELAAQQEEFRSAKEQIRNEFADRIAQLELQEACAKAFPSGRDHTETENDTLMSLHGLEVKRYARIGEGPDGQPTTEMMISIRKKGVDAFEGDVAIDLNLGALSDQASLERAKSLADSVDVALRINGADLLDGKKLNLESPVFKLIKSKSIGIGRLENVKLIGNSKPIRGEYGSGDLTGLNLSNAQIVGDVEIKKCYGASVNMSGLTTQANSKLIMTNNRFGYLNARGMDLRGSRGSSISNNHIHHSEFEDTALGSCLFRNNFCYNTGLAFKQAQSYDRYNKSKRRKDRHFSTNPITRRGQFFGTVYSEGAFLRKDGQPDSDAAIACDAKGGPTKISADKVRTALEGLNNKAFSQSIENSFGGEFEYIKLGRPHQDRIAIAFNAPDGRSRLVVARNPEDERSGDVLVIPQLRNDRDEFENDESGGGLYGAYNPQAEKAIQEASPELYGDFQQSARPVEVLYKKPVRKLDDNGRPVGTTFEAIAPQDAGGLSLSSMQAEHAIHHFMTGELAGRKVAEQQYGQALQEAEVGARAKKAEAAAMEKAAQKRAEQAAFKAAEEAEEADKAASAAGGSKEPADPDAASTTPDPATTGAYS